MGFWRAMGDGCFSIDPNLKALNFPPYKKSGSLATHKGVYLPLLPGTVGRLLRTLASRSTALACARFLFDMLGRSMTPPRSDVVRACAPQSSRTCLHYVLARGCVVLEAPRRWRRLRGLAVLASALGLFWRASTVLPPPSQPCALPRCAHPQETIYVRRTAL